MAKNRLKTTKKTTVILFSNNVLFPKPAIRPNYAEKSKIYFVFTHFGSFDAHFLTHVEKYMPHIVMQLPPNIDYFTQYLGVGPNTQPCQVAPGPRVWCFCWGCVSCISFAGVALVPAGSSGSWQHVIAAVQRERRTRSDVRQLSRLYWLSVGRTCVTMLSWHQRLQKIRCRAGSDRQD